MEYDVVLVYTWDDAKIDWFNRLCSASIRYQLSTRLSLLSSLRLARRTRTTHKDERGLISTYVIKPSKSLASLQVKAIYLACYSFKILHSQQDLTASVKGSRLSIKPNRTKQGYRKEGYRVLRVYIRTYIQ
jgi:hypothetical protein